MSIQDLSDDDFGEWFDNIVNSIGSFRLVLPDTVYSALDYAMARDLAPFSVHEAGYESFNMAFTWRGSDVMRIDYRVIDENGKELIFASIEKEDL